MLQSVFDLFRQGYVIPYVILALLTVSWVVILERFFVLQLRYRIHFTKFNQSIRKMLAAGDLDRAENFCNATAKVGPPYITVRAIDTFESDSFRVRAVISEETLHFMPRIRRRISQLPTLATTAVLLGALASVNGIWHSFAMSEGLEAGMKSAVFSQSLGTALTPLALSLFVAALVMLPYGILEAMAGRLEGEMEHGVSIILNLLAPEGPTLHAQPAVSRVTESARHEPAYSDPEPTHAETQSNAKVDPDLANERSEPVLDEEEII